MQVCTLLQTDNHASTPPLGLYMPDRMPFLPPNQLRQSTEGKAPKAVSQALDLHCISAAVATCCQLVCDKLLNVAGQTKLTMLAMVDRGQSATLSVQYYYYCAVCKLVAWHSGRTSVSDWRTFPVLRSTCS